MCLVFRVKTKQIIFPAFCGENIFLLPVMSEDRKRKRQMHIAAFLRNTLQRNPTF